MSFWLNLASLWHVWPGPKETQRICWMLGLQSFPYPVTWPRMVLMHAEEVDGRWSWRSMAQRYEKLNVPKLINYVVTHQQVHSPNKVNF